MADFVLLYRGGSTPESDEARAAAMDAWTAWFASLGSAVKDGGNPFTEVAKHVRSEGAIGDVPATVSRPATRSCRRTRSTQRRRSRRDARCCRAVGRSRSTRPSR